MRCFTSWKPRRAGSPGPRSIRRCPSSGSERRTSGTCPTSSLVPCRARRASRQPGSRRHTSRMHPRTEATWLGVGSGSSQHRNSATFGGHPRAAAPDCHGVHTVDASSVRVQLPVGLTSRPLAHCGHEVAEMCCREVAVVTVEDCPVELLFECLHLAYHWAASSRRRLLDLRSSTIRVGQPGWVSTLQEVPTRSTSEAPLPRPRTPVRLRA